jgi:hypothetical protein
MRSEKQRWALLGLLLALSALLASQAATASSSVGMAVDAIPGGAVDAGVSVAVGAAFQVDVVITGASIPYQGYQAFLSWDDTLVTSADPVGVTYTGVGGMTLNSVPVAVDADIDTVIDGVHLGSANGEAATTATGAVAAVGLHCVANGTSALHLIKLSEDPGFGTTALGTGGVTIETGLTDAQVTCGAGGPLATPSAPTATPGGPAPTPSVPPPPGATPTPLPPGYEAVALSAACNPVTTTYADATPAQSIAAAVGPAGNLQALWKFGGGVWMGYSPAYPQASDLTALDLLDVVFICVGGPGSFARPIV